MTTLHWILFAISAILIGLVMLQESKNDVKNTFSGEKSDLFKNQKQRGPELFMARLTLGFALIFGLFAILATVL
ncbi:MAG: preprotein translocase subunit SecG [Candidatus Izemoplasmatales bacterium]